jgi:hypothetical protein
MVALKLTTGDRAAAALVGIVVGAQLGIDPVTSPEEPEGMRLAPALPDSPWPASGAVAVQAATAFAGTKPDLRAFALALGDWDARDGRGASLGLRRALRELHREAVPVAEAQEAIAEPLLAAIPIGIVARHSARNLASAATHVTALLAPHAEVQHAAVALAVVAAHLASGHTDFISEVIEAMKVDGAPEQLLAVPRRVPLTRREQLAGLLADVSPAQAVLEAALWCADREPIAARGAALLAGMPLAPEVRSAACAAALGLMALRDGMGAVPRRWQDQMPQCDTVASLGRRLAP